MVTHLAMWARRRGEQVLVEKRSVKHRFVPGSWGLPYEVVEPEEPVARESAGRLLGTFMHSIAKGYKLYGKVVEVDALHGKEMLVREEGAEAGWVEISQGASLLTSPMDRKAWEVLR